VGNRDFQALLLVLTIALIAAKDKILFFLIGPPAEPPKLIIGVGYLRGRNGSREFRLWL